MARARDPDRTRREIIASVGRLLVREGFDRIGVNAVAREAGCDKVLIYRYFHGLPELLRAYAEQTAFWPSLLDLLPVAPGQAAGGLQDQAVLVFRNLITELRKRPTTLEILRWEMVRRSELTDVLADLRERQGVLLLRSLIKDQAGLTGDPPDLQAIAAVLSAGIYYLLLRQKGTDVYLGIPLNSDEGWARISAAVEYVVRTVVAAAPAEAAGA